MHAVALLFVSLIGPAALPTTAVFTQQSPASSPTQRRSAGFAEQVVGTNAKLWIFGGYAAAGDKSDLWYYDTQTQNWVSATQTNPPSGHDRHALGWDPLHQRLVMVGGVKQSGFSFPVTNEVWVYDPSTNAWTQLVNSLPAPAARADPAMVWDPSSNHFLVFGGSASASNTNTKFGDLWTLSIDLATMNARWNQLSPSGTAPSARATSCAVFDDSANQLVIFGGELAGGAAAADTWIYDVASNSWSQPAVTGTVPSGRSFAACTWDPTQQFVTLYGGYDGSAVLNGLYFFDPAISQWQSASPSSTPGNLSDASAVFSTALNRTVLFGGQSAIGSYGNQTWTLEATSPTNQAPGANAGPDQIVDEAQLVTLDGSGSSDPDLDPLTFQWTQTAGPAVTLSSNTVAQPTFTAPDVLAPVTLSFSLEVSDGQLTSAVDTVDVQVRDAINEPPQAVVQAPMTVTSGDPVILDGTGSSDPNGESLTYAWSELSGPTVNIGMPQSVLTGFTAPLVSAESTVRIRLKVTDARLASDAAEVDIVILPGASADAGQDGGEVDGGMSGADAGVDAGSSQEDGGVDGGGVIEDGGSSIDGGLPTDAGSNAGEPARLAVGCGCTTAKENASALLLALAFGLLWRKRATARGSA